MRKIFLMMALAGASAAMAQDAYNNSVLLGNDLNGTARYMGMGGALEALGADMTTITTNPAGLGLMRHSNVSASLGMGFQDDAANFDDKSSSHVNFGHMGFVISGGGGGENSYFNLAMSYHKHRNFNHILSAANALRGASLNKLAYAKQLLGSESNGGYWLDLNEQKTYVGWVESEGQYMNDRAYTYTQWDHVYSNAFIPQVDPVTGDDYFGYAEADMFNFDRAQRGWVSEFDFALSGNVNNRFFWGFGVAVYDIRYKSYSEYGEGLIADDGSDLGTTVLADEQKITGQGYDVKFGAILRPVENSPFRIGAYVHTPTWYKPTVRNSTTLYNRSKQGNYEHWSSSEEYKYCYNTPWLFGLSIGHTIGKELALGASYEYQKYSAADTRVIDSEYDDGRVESSSDTPQNHIAHESFNGVSTLKLGVEYKPTSEMAIRLGYNYLSAPNKKSGYRNTMVASYSNSYSSTPDYTNWDATHRITAGFGYKIDGWSIDLAYVYNTTKGEFHPYQSLGAVDHDNVGPIEEPLSANNPTVTPVSFKRHQVQLTLGYTF